MLALSLFGLLVPNGLFIHAALSDPGAVWAAMSSPVSAVFMGEAMALTGLFAWLLHRRGNPTPGWLGFVALSLLGSLLFSVPLSLYLQARNIRDPRKT
jgi:hypothetical protein